MLLMLQFVVETEISQLALATLGFFVLGLSDVFQGLNSLHRCNTIGYLGTVSRRFSVSMQ